ncbi:MAG: hypothetical protein EOL91_04445 [Actinobacteria bacterium]|nr:hypothetical protein [Actinomycetota bacterium]
MTVTSTTPDPLSRTMAMVYGGGGVIVLGVAVNVALDGNWLAVVIYAGLAALLAYQAWSAHGMRGAELTLDDDGARRAGPWGWRLPWSAVGSASVEEFRERQYLVVNRANPNAGSHHSSSWLFGSGFPRSAYVVPLDPDRVADVQAALAARGVSAD